MGILNFYIMPEIHILQQRRCAARLSYYERLFPDVEKVTVSDQCPNPPFTKPEEYGWTEVSELPKGYKGEVFYKNASVGGKSRTYIEAQ